MSTSVYTQPQVTQVTIQSPSPQGLPGIGDERGSKILIQPQVTQVIVRSPGPQGPKGASAYEIAVHNGFVGTEEAWLSSLVPEYSIFVANIATTEPTVLDSWDTSLYRSAKYLVQISQSSNYQISEVLLTHSGPLALMTEYGTLETAQVLGSVSCDVLEGSLRVLITLGSSELANVNLQRVLIGV